MLYIVEPMYWERNAAQVEPMYWERNAVQVEPMYWERNAVQVEPGASPKDYQLGSLSSSSLSLGTRQVNCL